MTDNSSVILEKRGQAFWITINRPDKRNALNGEVIAGIAKGYRDAHEDSECEYRPDRRRRQGVLRRRRPAKQRRGVRDGFFQANVDYADLLRLSQNATKPAIARVGGVCMAGGMGLLCMTDMAVAAEHVMFGLPEVKVGVFPMQVLSLLQIDRAAAPDQRMGADRRAVRRQIGSGRRASELCGAGGRTRRQGRLADRPHHRQVADRDPARQIRHARDRLDVVRREHRLHRKPDRAVGDDGGRQGRPQGVRRKAQAVMAGEIRGPQ